MANGRFRRGAPAPPDGWRDWVPALAVCALLIFVSGAAVMYLSLQASHGKAVGLATSRQTADAPASTDAAAQLAGAPALASPVPVTAADGPSLPSPPATAVLAPEPPRLSDQAEHLSDAELHGGWQFSWEVRLLRGAACLHAATPARPAEAPLAVLQPMPALPLAPQKLKPSPQIFDQATKHPNATVVSWSSPRVVLIRDFLAPEEIEHTVQQATGALGLPAGELRLAAAAWVPCWLGKRT